MNEQEKKEVATETPKKVVGKKKRIIAVIAVIAIVLGGAAVYHMTEMPAPACSGISMQKKAA